MHAQPDPFEMLGLEPRFDLDLKSAEEKHRALSGALHPDRYVSRPAGERRMALDKAILVNQAWRLLRDPVGRAEALLASRGVAVGELGEPKAPPALLMEMMEMREELSEARRANDLDRIAKLADGMRDKERAVLSKLASGFEEARDDRSKLEALLPLLGELRYLRRFFEELDAIEDEIDGRA
jgi:molecular chaperone HscB